jgi:chromosome segregation ATPase
MIYEGDETNISSIISKLEAILDAQRASGEKEGTHSASLDAHTAQITERLDRQNEELQRQLEKKAEENGSLSAMVKAGEQRYANLEAEYEALKKDLEGQDLQVTELEEMLFAMDAARYKSEERQHQLATAEKQNEQLAEQLESKAAAIKELENSLRCKDEAYMSEVRQFTGNLVKLNQTLQEKEATSKTLAEQAAELARREMRIEMERAVSKTQMALEEAQRQMDSLQGDTTRLKQAADKQAEAMRQDAQTSLPLRNASRLQEAKKRRSQSR